jgi:hypothetical protein
LKMPTPAQIIYEYLRRCAVRDALKLYDGNYMTRPVREDPPDPKEQEWNGDDLFNLATEITRQYAKNLKMKEDKNG